MVKLNSIGDMNTDIMLPNLPKIDYLGPMIALEADENTSNVPRVEAVQAKCNLAPDDDKILTDIFNTRIRQDDGNVKNK